MVYERKAKLRKPKTSVALQCRRLQLSQIKRQYERVLEANEEMAEKIEELKMALVEAGEHNRSLASELVEQNARQLTVENRLRGLLVQINEGIIDALRPLGNVTQILIRQIQAVEESHVANRVASFINPVQAEECARDIYEAKKEARQTLNKALCDLMPIQEESPGTTTPPLHVTPTGPRSEARTESLIPATPAQAEKSTKEATPKNETEINAVLSVSLSMSIRNDNRQINTPSPYASFVKRQRDRTSQLDPDQLQFDSTIVLTSDKEAQGSDSLAPTVSAGSPPVKIKSERTSESDDKENEPAQTPPTVFKRSARTRSKTKLYNVGGASDSSTTQTTMSATARKPRATKKSSKRS